MNLDANDLLLFARVAAAGSFSRAGEQLGLPKSTVSRRIAALEGRLGERLLTRSTRHLSLTDFGRGIATHAQRLAEETDAATAFAQSRQEKPRGLLRVSMPPGFTERSLGTMLARFAADYPEVRLVLDLSARRVDLIAEQFDLAIRVASALPDDATLVASRICDERAGLYASPAYLARHGVPQHPDELLHGHVGLHLVTSNGEPREWKLDRDGEKWSGLPAGPFAANAIGLLREMAVDGVGIADLSNNMVSAQLRAGELVRVLPAWHPPVTTLWAVMPSRRHVPTRCRVFLACLTQALQDLQC